MVGNACAGIGRAADVVYPAGLAGNRAPEVVRNAFLGDAIERHNEACR